MMMMHSESSLPSMAGTEHGDKEDRKGGGASEEEDSLVNNADIKKLLYFIHGC